MRLFRRRLAALEERVRFLEDQQDAYERVLAIMTGDAGETQWEYRRRHLRVVDGS